MSAVTDRSAREVVTRRVVRRARQFPDLELAPLDTSALTDASGRDAALAAAIDHAVARRWLTLAAVLDHHLSRRWDTVEPGLQGVLLVGAAQLLLFERIPDHAAINEAVTLAKRLVRPKAGGLVNAVLRKVAAGRGDLVERFDPSRRDELPLSDGRAWRLATPVFAEAAERRLAQQTSHPESLITRWRAKHGAAAARELAEHGLVHAPIIIAAEGDRALDGCTPHETPGFHVFDGARAELDTLLARHPHARVQDPTSAAPVERTRGLDPGVVMDVCAGRGTKTRQLAEVHPSARIVATDAHPGRVAELRETFAGHDRIEIIPYESLPERRGQADLLVLDVPCSNTGVLARRVEARYRLSDDTLRQLVDLQRQIVADTLALLANGGHLLYATCSIEPAENADQAAWIAQWHPLREVGSALALPQGVPGQDPSHYADGGYYALMA